MEHRANSNPHGVDGVSAVPSTGKRSRSVVEEEEEEGNYSGSSSSDDNEEHLPQKTQRLPQDKQREIHNMVERMRRYRISSCIANIAERIPNLGQDKLDKASVLDTALRYLKYIRNTCANIQLIDEAYMAQFGGGRPTRRARHAQEEKARTNCSTDRRTGQPSKRQPRPSVE